MEIEISGLCDVYKPVIERIGGIVNTNDNETVDVRLTDYEIKSNKGYVTLIQNMIPKLTFDRNDYVTIQIW